MQLNRNNFLKFLIQSEPGKPALANGLRAALSLGIPMLIGQSIEANAIIIPWKELIAPASDYATIHDVLEQNNSLNSDRVLTNNDRDLGTLLDLYFDENADNTSR